MQVPLTKGGLFQTRELSCLHTLCMFAAGHSIASCSALLRLTMQVHIIFSDILSPIVQPHRCENSFSTTYEYLENVFGPSTGIEWWNNVYYDALSEIIPRHWSSHVFEMSKLSEVQSQDDVELRELGSMSRPSQDREDSDTAALRRAGKNPVLKVSTHATSKFWNMWIIVLSENSASYLCSVLAASY